MSVILEKPTKKETTNDNYLITNESKITIIMESK